MFYLEALMYDKSTSTYHTFGPPRHSRIFSVLCKPEPVAKPTALDPGEAERARARREAKLIFDLEKDKQVEIARIDGDRSIPPARKAELKQHIEARFEARRHNLNVGDL